MGTVTATQAGSASDVINSSLSIVGPWTIGQEAFVYAFKTYHLYLLFYFWTNLEHFFFLYETCIRCRKISNVYLFLYFSHISRRCGCYGKCVLWSIVRTTFYSRDIILFGKILRTLRLPLRFLLAIYMFLSYVFGVEGGTRKYI